MTFVFGGTGLQAVLRGVETPVPENAWPIPMLSGLGRYIGSCSSTESRYMFVPRPGSKVIKTSATDNRRRRGLARFCSHFCGVRRSALNPRGSPIQALQHNDPSCHVSCLRMPRASWGRG
jgi:hypothetical protein